MQLLQKFMDEHPNLNYNTCELINSIVKSSHPAIYHEWKWRTLCFSINKKVFAYFSVKKGMLHLGLWGKKNISSSIIKRDLKIIGYYLIQDLTDELLADIAISCEEVIEGRLSNFKKI